MSEIRVEAVFQASGEATVGRMCEIDPALAGFPLTTEVDVLQVVLEFPKFDGRFPAAGYFGWSGDDASAPVALLPAHFLVHTQFAVASGLGEPELQVELKAAVEAIRFAAARLSDALRVEQPNVGLVGEIPKMLSLKATDTTDGRELRVGQPLVPGYPIVVGLPPLTVDAAMSSLRDGVSPARAALSQARHLTQSTNSPQPGLATLLALVAAESFAKEHLATRQAADRPSLRNLQQKHGSSVVKHYDQIAEALIGSSLKDDDPMLYEDLGSAFNARNRMAHKLEAPTHQEVKKLVVTAMKAMDWLRTRP
ncbi:hypothetical protein ACFYS8_23745 [Kitasatospora sp. NPDC004615]|uniref:hypothetical protein n=1 Tax=Kitasatospora sp. NPDC004615 TaxID=3364017 RepID=UPI0036991B39